MRKIINGKRYDTNTAVPCGIYTCGSRDVEHSYSEVLYQKRTGEFFLYGEGGSQSPYAKEATINYWKGGERITPLSEKEAQEWVRKHLTDEEYKRIFSVVDEPESGRKIVSFSLGRNAIAKVTELARSSGLSRSQIVEDLITNAYEERKGRIRHSRGKIDEPVFRTKSNNSAGWERTPSRDLDHG